MWEAPKKAKEPFMQRSVPVAISQELTLKLVVSLVLDIE
jgi:hypothetical protein